MNIRKHCDFYSSEKSENVLNASNLPEAPHSNHDAQQSTRDNILFPSTLTRNTGASFAQSHRAQPRQKFMYPNVSRSCTLKVTRTNLDGRKGKSASRQKEPWNPEFRVDGMEKCNMVRGA